MNHYKNTRSGITIQATQPPNWGGEWINLDQPEPAAEPEPEVAAEPATPEPNTLKLPAPRATAKTWVDFMAANNIKHPDDATRAEMRAIAEHHVNQLN